MRFLPGSKSAWFTAVLVSASCCAGGETPHEAVKVKPLSVARYFPQGSRAIKPLASSGNVAVVNAASFLPGVSPGGFVTIFGSNLSDVSGVVVADTNPLPYELAHVSVSINGINAPIYAVAYNGTEDQITVQVPAGTATGPSAALIQVYDYGLSVGSGQTDSYDEDPGIFTYNDNYSVALLYPDYSLIGTNNPAYPNDYIILYTTGLGPVSIYVPDGYAAPLDQPAYTQDPFQVLVDGEPCQVYFSGLAPGFAGLYQLNVELPADLRSGNLSIQITSSYANSNVAILPVF